MTSTQKLTSDEMEYLKDIGSHNLKLDLGKVAFCRAYARMNYLEDKCVLLEALNVIPIDEIVFVKTRDGRLGVGWCPNKEAGGFHVELWCSDEMLKAAAAALLNADQPAKG